MLMKVLSPIDIANAQQPEETPVFNPRVMRVSKSIIVQMADNA
jgi:hypothetical protein